MIVFEERFWAKVDFSGDCWLWLGAKSVGGYGACHTEGCSIPGAAPHQGGAHRVAYLLLVGPIPTGLQLDHLCRNTSCVNPDHLEPVLPAENLRRARGAPRWPEQVTHCKRGHRFTAWNTIWRVRYGKRYPCCRTCKLEDRYPELLERSPVHP